MKVKFLLMSTAFLFLAAWFTACTTPSGVSPASCLQQAEALMADHAFERAEYKAGLVLKRRSAPSERVSAYRILAWCAHRRGREEEAEAHWDAALDQAAGRAKLAADVLMERGLGSWERADYEHAVVQFAYAEAALRAAGLDTRPARYWHALSLHAAGRLEDALAAYRDLLPDVNSEPVADLLAWRIQVLEEETQP